MIRFYLLVNLAVAEKGAGAFDVAGEGGDMFSSLYQIESWKSSLGIFIPFGKISLSCYVFSSVFGFFIYYGCGLGLYQYTGAIISFCIGLVLLTGLWIFSKFWSRSHTRGPLEQIWHKLTWI